MTFTSIMVGTATVLTSGHESGLVIAALMGLAGIGTSLAGALRLPGWARRRAEQFDALGAFARRLAGE